MNERLEPSNDLIEKLIRSAEPLALIPEDRIQRSRAVVVQEWERKVRARRRRKLAKALAAAAVIVLVVIAVRLRQTPVPALSAKEAGVVTRIQGSAQITDQRSPEQPQEVRPNSAVPVNSELVTRKDGRILLMLDDRANLRLDANTALRIDSEMSFFLSRGAVYFDSGTDRAGASAIQIETPRGTVRHTGTQFEVKTIGEALRLRVREGRASVRFQDAVHEAEDGAQLIIDATGKITRSTYAKNGEDWNWISGVPSSFTLEGSALKDFLAWICRENGWNLQYGKTVRATTLETTLHGSIEGFKTEEMLATVLPACDLVYKMKDGTLWIDQQ